MLRFVEVGEDLQIHTPVDGHILDESIRRRHIHTSEERESMTLLTLGAIHRDLEPLEHGQIPGHSSAIQQDSGTTVFLAGFHHPIDTLFPRLNAELTGELHEEVRVLVNNAQRF